MTTGRVWMSGVRAIAYSLLSRDALMRRLNVRLDIPGRGCRFTTSGRVALLLAAQVAAVQTFRRVALVPDYICNVVPVAIERAGFVVETYPTDPANEPDDDYLIARLGRNDVGLLVTASVFGSSAWLDRLASDDVREHILRSGVHVIVDACQDLSLIHRLPDGYGDALSAVISFNHKSLPGLMGGVALTTAPIGAGPLPKPSAEQRSFLRRQMLARIRAWLLGRPPAPAEEPGGFEYSYCRTFPYDFGTDGMTRLQMIVALVGLDNLPVFEAAKAELFAVGGASVVPPRFRSAAFVVVSDPDLMPDRRRKRPYATAADPATSLRPHQTILHNKGFLDHRV